MLEWTLLNSAVALCGYYFAAFTIDKPWMGRMRMQCMGFAWMVGGGLSVGPLLSRSHGLSNCMYKLRGACRFYYPFRCPPQI